MASMGDSKDAYAVFVETPERNRPLGRPSRRWEDNIRLDPHEVGWGSVE